MFSARSQNYEKRLIASSCLSVCLSVRLCFHPHEKKTRLPRDGFSWNLIFECCFRKYAEKTQVSLKSSNNNGTVHEDQYTFWSYLAQLFLERTMFHTNIVEKIKTHILPSITFCRKSCRLRNNVQKCCTAHAHCMLDTQRYKRTLGICNTYCFSTATVVVRTRLNVTLYVHCLSCSIFLSLRCTGSTVKASWFDCPQ